MDLVSAFALQELTGLFGAAIGKGEGAGVDEFFACEMGIGKGKAVEIKGVAYAFEMYTVVIRIDIAEHFQGTAVSHGVIDSLGKISEEEGGIVLLVFEDQSFSAVGAGSVSVVCVELFGVYRNACAYRTYNK